MDQISGGTSDTYKDLVEVSDNFEALLHNSGVMINDDILSMDVKPISGIAPTPLRNLLVENAEESLYIDKDEAKIKRF